MDILKAVKEIFKGKIHLPYTSTYVGSLVPYAIDYENFANTAYDNPFFTAPLNEIIRCFNTAQIGVYKKLGNGELKKVDHIVDNWLKAPNFALTQDQYQTYWILWYYIGGGLLMWKTPGTFYKEIYLYRPDAFDIKRDDNTLRIKEIRIGSKHVTAENELKDYRIVRAINPDDYVAGCDVGFRSPIKSLALLGDMTTFAFTHQNRQMKNSGKRTGILESKKRLDPEKKKEIKKQFLGLGNKDAGSIAVVEGEDYKFTPMDITPQEMDWLQSVKFLREVIAATLGVPIQLISSEGTTYNNVREFKKKIYNDVINPLLDLFCNIHTAFFADELEGKYVISYDTSNIEELRLDVTEIIKGLADGLIGKVTLNEFRTIVNNMTGISLAALKPEEGDVLLVHSNLSIITDLLPMNTAKDDGDDDGQQT